MIYNRFEVDKVLVIAPLRVAQSTWGAEIGKWEHLKALKVSKVLGDKKERIRALGARADMFIINRENVAWLVDHYENYGMVWDFDMVVIDELSSFKSNKATRFKKLRKVVPKCHRVVGLTGTPTPQGLIDLWAQVYLIDQGERLGKTITGYRDRYFLPDKRNGAIVYSYKLKNDAEKTINKQLEDICISMRSRDWLQLPETIHNMVEVEMSDREAERYATLELEAFLEFENAETYALSSGVLANKLLQISNGAIYAETENGDRIYEHIHDRKIDALKEIIETNEHSNILVFYNFRHDAERIHKNIKGVTDLKTEKHIEDWNKGKIKIMLTHPASAGHGLNLQTGGHIIVWFGLTWSLELYEQANARLDRQGQKESVVIHHIITKNTVDEEVMLSLQRKEKVQDRLMQALRNRTGAENGNKG